MGKCEGFVGAQTRAIGIDKTQRSLYLVSNPSANLDQSLNIVTALVQGIETSFQTATREAPWSLQYRLFRDTLPPKHTPPTDAQGKPQPVAHTLQHHLHLSSIDPNRTFICEQPPNAASTINAIPLRQQEAYLSLGKHQLAALWQPRHILSLQQGTCYTAGLCTVQIGELRAVREGPQSAGVQSPGVLVCITTTIGPLDSIDQTSSIEKLSEDEEDIDFDYAQAIIRNYWNKIKENRDLGRSEVREIMMQQVKSQDSGEIEAAVQMWCEALRLRG